MLQRFRGLAARFFFSGLPKQTRLAGDSSLSLRCGMSLAARQATGHGRRRWTLTGRVQGVGFRPFVYRLAVHHGLTGFVRNDPGGLTIEAQGLAEALDRFAADLTSGGGGPPLAVIHQIVAQELTPEVDTHPAAFHIQPSADDAAATAEAAVDTAVCPACLKELLDPANRRYRYGLINCTDCGPRLSIIQRLPYDRPNTTMAGFAMCDQCRAEYTAPADRRFHAQPVACPECGPTVRLVDARGGALPGDAIDSAAKLLRDGQVLAIKGLGGFHLAARADSDAAVGRLRQLKHRDHKPFALMCATLDDARWLVQLGAPAERLMASPACPIILAPRRARAGNPGNPGVSAAVAPESHRLGVMLPYTPIQHLLMMALHGDESGGGGPLVMTSGNQSDEPLVIDNDEALSRLGAAGLCDAILWHDRPIQRCVDDSVLIDMGEDDPLPIRRARGFVPASHPLTIAAVTDGLCVGGELKSVVAAVRGERVILSQHLGDLTHPLAFSYFKQAIADLCDLAGVRPRWIAHDLHPAYLSTQHARELARRWGVPLIPVQHHHAHALSALAEHSQTGPALAVVCDGVGYGPDGTAWGGELLHVDGAKFQRVARLTPLRLPGGDAAARETARCGLALLYQAFGDDFADHPAARRLLPDGERRTVLTQMIRRDINCMISSGAGRVFDGVAALLGLVDFNHFEARAGQVLEAQAFAAEPPPDFPPDFPPDAALFTLRAASDNPTEIDLSPLIRDILNRQERSEPVSSLARLFHEALAAAWEAAVMQGVARTGLRTVVLSGGVFCNQLLTERLTQRLRARGCEVLRHRLVPPNDGGLALGQAVAAVARACQ
jgi:hydrogenase maturation protein HypF